jgi:hypothetical protein
METRETISPHSIDSNGKTLTNLNRRTNGSNHVNILGHHRKSEGRMIEYLDLNFKEDARPFLKETPKDPGDFRIAKEFINVGSGFGFLAAVFSVKNQMGPFYVPAMLVVSMYIGSLIGDFIRSYKHHQKKKEDFKLNGNKDYADLLAKELMRKADESQEHLGSATVTALQEHKDLSDLAN